MWATGSVTVARRALNRTWYGRERKDVDSGRERKEGFRKGIVALPTFCRLEGSCVWTWLWHDWLFEPADHPFPDSKTQLIS